ncbi:MAG: rhodanese-like domain-containing protein, partial [Pyrinomonadaceae bacterium]
KSSFHSASPFRKHEVKIKPEIVTLKQLVDISKGAGTHVAAKDWNEVISDPEVFVLDTRNDYEYKNGSFRSAVNPETSKFSELPDFVAKSLDPITHAKIAMFCTGGIRCEKFAPYLKSLGFAEVFQLQGGILKYLEEVPKEAQLWEGECFVFDERRTLTNELGQGSGPDHSQRHKNKKHQ